MRKLFIYSYCFIQILCCHPSWATVTVTFTTGSDPTLQESFIAETTAAYLSTITPSLYFKDTYSLLISKKNISSSSVNLSSPGIYVVQIASSTRMIYQSTAAINDVFIYGWVDGETFERKDNMQIINDFSVNCSSPSLWTIPIDSMTCINTIGAIIENIGQKNYESPVPVPIPPDWGF